VQIVKTTPKRIYKRIKSKRITTLRRKNFRIYIINIAKLINIYNMYRDNESKPVQKMFISQT